MSANNDDCDENTPLVPHPVQNGDIERTPTPPNQDHLISFVSPGQWHTQTHGSDTSSSLMTLAADKKMSDSRRTFCLFVTFDFIVTILLWIILCGVSSSSSLSFYTILYDQVCQLDLRTSLFDVVILAAVRFCFLELTFAAFRVRHWWPVAICTVVCDILLILKIFATFATPDVGHYCNVPMTIVLLLADFIFTWIEVWFIDSKVLPGEMKTAQKTVQAFLQQSYQSTMPEEHRNLIMPRNFPSTAASEHFSFFSAPESEAGHTAVGAESMYYSMHGYNRTMLLNNHIIQEGVVGLNSLWAQYTNRDLWKTEKQLKNGDVVYSMETPEYGKSFKIEAEIDVAPHIIFQEIVTKTEEMPDWNKTVASVKVLRRIGDKSSVTLEVSSPAALGLIPSREFVTVRRIDKIGDVFISAGVSTQSCEELVPKTNFIRGVNGPTGFIIAPGKDGPHSSSFVWILNTDLKGNLSRSLVNRNLTSTVIDFVSALRRRLAIYT
uniref:StAR-related lipid transfer protein 3 n=1 Tax=Phallusia mammillata TaxID=59560 RepID=A0A6F9DUI5_9ASCI|nr:stAR-related lipid transfer protein 3 [Phallusia mammillata]